ALSRCAAQSPVLGRGAVAPIAPGARLVLMVGRSPDLLSPPVLPLPLCQCAPQSYAAAGAFTTVRAPIPLYARSSATTSAAVFLISSGGISWIISIGALP